MRAPEKQQPALSQTVDQEILAEAIADLSKRRGLGACIALFQIRARYIADAMREAS